MLCKHFSLCSGIHITGNDKPVPVGSDLELNCSSDLTILTAEWLQGEVVITESEGSGAVLVVSEVDDSLHDREYTCRTTTPYGVQEVSTTITITGKLTHVHTINYTSVENTVVHLL